jgi:methionine sulfoxide reductase catalytic subunit
MQYFLRRPFDLSQSRHTPAEVYSQRGKHRREFLKWLGRGTLLAPALFGLAGCKKPSDQEILEAGAVEPESELEAGLYPARRNPKFEYGRPETSRRAAAEFTNFYEFTSKKDVWRHMPDFHPPEDWQVEIGGLCTKPRVFDMDDLYAKLKPRFEERAYRLRCVETWAMCIPWTGFPLRELLKLVEPKPSAKFVALETFGPRDDAGNMRDESYPWPYRETLTIREAMNDLAFIATGVFGEPLPKQHGTPLRLVVPWKYGFKSIKSLVKITLTEHQTGSFWNDVWPEAYDIPAIVNPEKRHPSWSQKTEWMLGTGDRYPTELYNGYGEYVGGLYS